jgi:hypothetical protein
MTPAASKIMLIRHAEKPPDNPPPHGVTTNGDHDSESLIVQGWQRAGALVVFFAPSVGPIQNPDIQNPNTIYASKVGSGSHSERPQETVTPLVAKLGGKVSVNFTFSKGDESQVALSAMAQSGVVLICWEHQNIPTIAQALNPKDKSKLPNEWPKGRYDLVWVFDLDTSTGTYSFSVQPQLLLFGDAPP